MNLDDPRSRLREWYTVMRGDRFVIDAGLWFALGCLARAMRDAYATRIAWENASGNAVAAELEQEHRRVHRDLVAKLATAAWAAGVSGAPESVPEAPRLVSGRATAKRPWGGRGEGVSGIPQPTRDADRTGGAL